jgi:hypothetical protein
VKNVTKTIRHYGLIEGLINQDGITIIIYVANTGSPKCMKQSLTELKGEIDNSTMIIGECNTILSIMVEHA